MEKIMDKFAKFRNAIVLNISGEEVRLNRVGPNKIQELFNLMKKEDEFVEGMCKYFTAMLSENYPAEKKEDIEQFVLSNVTSLPTEFQIAYGLLDRDKFEKSKAELERKAVEDTAKKG
jgi:hypothetical protein